MRIRPEDIDAVRAATNIADVISRHVQLRPAGGGRLKGLCPFHEEKSPSLSVSPDKNVFHCFGCGAGGDAIDFVKEIAGIDFVEAIETLATITGVALHYDDTHTAPRGPTGSSRQRCAAANAEAADYYRQQIQTPAAAAATTVLADRLLDSPETAPFNVGYAPEGWDQLLRHLRGRGYTDKELLDAGLARQGRNGPIDAFRNRLIWPIVDTSGLTIGFGARRLDDTATDSPKYINTTQTPLYNKSKVLYGLNLARPHIQVRRNVRIVEGYTDVMACHLAGAPDTIATCGTALTEEHLAVLLRILGDDATLTLCFDPDGAGASATLRLLAAHPILAARTTVTDLPDGLDPADLRKERGDQALLEALARTTSLISFAIGRALHQVDLSTPEGQAIAARRVTPILATITDPVLRTQHLHAVATRLALTVDALQAGLPTLDAALSPQAPAQPASTPNRYAGPAREAIKLALAHPELSQARAAVALVDDPRYAGVVWAIAAAARQPAHDGAAWITAVRAACNSDDDQRLVAALAVEPLTLTEDFTVEDYATALFDRLSTDSPTGEDEDDLRQLLRTASPAERAQIRKRLVAVMRTLEQKSD